MLPLACGVFLCIFFKHQISITIGKLFFVAQFSSTSICTTQVLAEALAASESIPSDSEIERHLRSYFAGIYPPDLNADYHVDRYPSYGPDWLDSGRRCISYLEELGVYELARTQEAFMRSVRQA
jgi:hypothetical protein